MSSVIHHINQYKLGNTGRTTLNLVLWNELKELESKLKFPLDDVANRFKYLKQKASLKRFMERLNA